jgi:hypothetical protein
MGMILSFLSSILRSLQLCAGKMMLNCFSSGCFLLYCMRL